MRLDHKFLIGAATAAHQVEGNNIHSDFWAMEHMKNTSFKEPSLDAVDHYNRYREDIDLMADAGLNAYRFSIEWARIEPVKGQFDEKEIEHYRSVLTYCREKGMEPIVTMHHFSSPKWLISEGGWEDKRTVDAFAGYCKYVVEKTGDIMTYVCTINEANMGLQIAALSKSFIKQMQSDVQVGIETDIMKARAAQKEEAQEVFGVAPLNTFLSMRTPQGNTLIMHAHEAARNAMKAVCPHLQIGITLSLYDIQAIEGGEQLAEREWDEEFRHYLPYIKNDDFLGVQNYTRKRIDKDGVMAMPEDAERTLMNYEFYPQAIGNVIRRVSGEIDIPILVTENGIAAADDSRRIAYIEEAMKGVTACCRDGIDVRGYMYWSLLDNFEWQKGFDIPFGLIAVDRISQKRYPKKSLAFLGKMVKGE